MLAVLKFLALLCLFFTVVQSEEGSNANTVGEVGVFEEEEEIVAHSPDVQTTTLFPRYPNHELPIGKPLEMYFSFKNTGEHTFNVTTFTLSLMHPDFTSSALQNFTTRRVNQIVRTGESWTFQYWFMPDPLLEPRGYPFVGLVQYVDEDSKNYSTAFFQSNVQLVESDSQIDLQSFFTSFLSFGILGLVAFIIYKSVAGPSTSSKKVSGTSSGTFSDNTAMSQWQKQQQATKKGKGGKK